MAVENLWCWRCCRCLADIDVDGNLAADEFCVAMYLIDMAKMGQSLPATLPPGLVPPSMQRLRRSSETPAATQLPCNCTHNYPCLYDFLCLSVSVLFVCSSLKGKSVCAFSNSNRVIYIVPLLGDHKTIISLFFIVRINTDVGTVCVYMLVTTMCLHEWLN